MKFSFGDDELSVQLLSKLVESKSLDLQLSKHSRDRMQKSRQLVENAIKQGRTIYGINTGFGLLSDVKIANDQIERLQENLIRSHATGVGPLLSEQLVKSIMIAKAQSLAFGPSGVRPLLVDHIIHMIQSGIIPCVPSKGSVGASGDLAPLAHIALCMIGEGKAHFRGELMPATAAFEKARISPIRLEAKEGLSLINGTQFMSGIGAIACAKAMALSRSADCIAALSLDAIRGSLTAFDPRIHSVRRQNGQTQVAENIRRIYADLDAIMRSHENCGKVQDPYSFRCVPQVHGASRDAIQYVESVLNRELNAVTDNPLVFDDSQVLSGGNFHGQPVALAMDFLAIAVAELGSISERRIEKLTNPVMSGLPAFLVKDSGLNSGFMISHVTAAALVSENKVLCHPASVDSIPTSADKEDHVSMGPIGARKAMEVIENTGNILGIEAAAAAQGVELLKPLVPNKYVSALFAAIRRLVPFLSQDQYIAPELENLAKWVVDDGPSKVLGEVGLQLN